MNESLPADIEKSIKPIRSPEKLISCAVLAMCLPFVLGIVRSYSIRLEEAERQSVRSELEARGTTLMSEVNSRQALLTGLEALVVTSGTGEELSRFFLPFARSLVGEDRTFRMVQVFPLSGPCLIHPVSGNEAVLGRTLQDLLADTRPGIREDIERTLTSGKITLSTPYELRQGGLGVVSRLAVYNAESSLMGIAVVILDFRTLIKTAGFDSNPGLRYAITDSNGAVFYGDREVPDSDPVSYRVLLPENFWTISAVPVTGWGNADRLVIIVLYVLAMLLAAMIALIVLLQLHRLELLRTTVSIQEQDLSENNVRIRQAADAASIGFFDLNRTSGTVTFSAEWMRLFDIPESAPSLAFEEWADRVHPEDRAAFLAALEPSEKPSAPDRRVEFRFRVGDGTCRWILMKAAPLSGVRGDRILGANLDITESRMAADRTRMLNAELERQIGEWSEGLGRLVPVIERESGGAGTGRATGAADTSPADQLEELRKWHAVTVGREQRILELKDEVNRLLVQSGGKPKYSSPEPDAVAGNGT